MVLPRPRGLIVIPKEHTTRSWLAKQQHATKHTAYHELLEALAGEGCPVCLLSGRSVYRYLHTLAYENVTDLDIRLELRARRGFCHAHTWQFAEEVSDGLATAIIYRDVIHSLLGEMEKRDGLPGPLRRLRRRPPDLLDRLRPRGECPACRVRASAVERHLGTLLAHLAEPELRDRFLVSPGLCLPHLRQALPTAPDADRADTLRRPTLAQQPPLLEGEGAGRPLSQREVEPQASDCPACRAQGEAELAAARERPGAGLCLPHFALAWSQAAGAVRERQREAQVEFYRAVRAELDEYIRKHDYRFSHESLAAEADSPRRAVAAVVGARSLDPPAWPPRG